MCLLLISKHNILLISPQPSDFAPFRTSPAVKQIFVRFSQNPPAHPVVASSPDESAVCGPAGEIRINWKWIRLENGSDDEEMDWNWNRMDQMMGGWTGIGEQGIGGSMESEIIVRTCIHQDYINSTQACEKPKQSSRTTHMNPHPDLCETN